MKTPFKNFSPVMRRSLCWLASLSVCLVAFAEARAGDIRVIEASEATGSSMAVVVGRTALAHTSLMQPVDERGKLVGYEHPTIQIERTLDNMEIALAEANTTLERIVKLNCYVKDADVVRDLNRVLSRKFPGAHKPAVSIVESELSIPGSYIAMDAVAATSFGLGQSKVERFTSVKLGGSLSAARVAVMPDGVQVYVSGQAERGNGSLRDATAATLQSLFKTLDFLNLTKAQIVQVKAFLKPMGSYREVEAEILKAFPGEKAPPFTFTEWTMTNPIEIELIVYAGNQGDRAREPIEFLTPPEMTASPLYSRITRINFGQVVYVSGLWGGAGGADTEIKDIFKTLDYALGKAGSDLRHMAKATYYVADPNAGSRLNDLRPNYLDPKRPPAASKAQVRGVAQKGKTVTVDMIAVTKP